MSANRFFELEAAAHACTARKEWAKAAELLSESVRLEPSDAGAHLNLGCALARLQRWQEAFQEFEWRFAYHQVMAKFRERFAQRPTWKGESLAGKTILVYSEGGIGDTIMWARLLPDLKRLGPRIILEVYTSLTELLRNQCGIDELLDYQSPVPDYDYSASILSLPHLLGHTGQGRTYLRSKYRAQTHPLGGPNVSLTWAGSWNMPRDSDRSIPLTAFAPLAQFSDVRFYGIQAGPMIRNWPSGTVNLGTVPPGLSLLHLGPRLESFAVTAAYLMAMDLVITVDTSVAHLAGALGKEVWLLLPHFHCWRWPVDGEETHWYPRMRIFRQPVAGDWASVVEKVSVELSRKGLTIAQENATP